MSNHTMRADFEDMAFDVNFDYYPASKGAREAGTGLQLEPDEQESWDICEVSMVNPDDPDIAAVDVTNCFNKSMCDWFEEQLNAHILDNDQL